MRDLAYVLPEYPSRPFVHAEIAALRATGLEVDVIAHREGPGGAREPLAHVGLDHAEIAAVLRGYRHLHAHFGDFGLRVLAPLAARAGRPWSVTVHARDLSGHEGAVRPEEWHAIDRNCRKIVATSRFHAALARAQGAPPDRVTVIPDAVRLAGLLATAPPPPTRLGRILAIGRPGKGFPGLVRAWARARRAAPGLTLEILGGAGLVAEPPAGLVLSPACPYADVLAAMAGADLVVASSGDMDGTPTVLAEAGALRRPVIASAIAGIEDLVCDGVNGLLVPAGDVDGLTSALLRLLARPDELRRLGSGGPVLAAAHDARRVADRLNREIFTA